MSYVVDASVAVKWFLNETYAQQAAQLLCDFCDKKVALIAPDIIVSEVGSVFWKSSILRSVISVEEATDSYRDFLAVGIDVRSSAGLASEAMRIAITERRPVYDAMYMALAEQERCNFITADERLYNALGKKFPRLRWIGDYSKT